MGIYDNIGSKKSQVSVRLSAFQKQKLTHICELFGCTEQRLMADMIDRFYMEYIDVASGRIDLSGAIRQSMNELLDDYTKLKQHKGLVKPAYTRFSSRSSV